MKERMSKKEIFYLVCLSVLFFIIEVSSFLWGSALQYDRTGIVEHSQFWRLFTGHFTHWGVEHFIWDASAFLIASFLLLRVSCFKLVFVILFSILFISLWILFFNPAVKYYRGLSGVDEALFFFLTLSVIFFSIKNRSYTACFTGILFLSFLSIKLGYEFLSGKMLFVGDRSGGKLLLSAHVAGAAAGVICFALFDLLHIETFRQHIAVQQS